MRFQVTLRLVLLTFTLAKVMSNPFQPPLTSGCLECEEEVWEEIPCDEVETTTLLPITLPPTKATTLPPVTNLPPTTLPPPPPPTPTTTPRITIRTTTPAIPITRTTRHRRTTKIPITIATTAAPPRTTPVDSNDGYKKCYCECKSGCKEFCRKVVVYADPKKEITQLTKTTQPLEGGQVEVKHLLERNWIPLQPAYIPNNNSPIHPNPYIQLPSPELSEPQLPAPELPVPKLPAPELPAPELPAPELPAPVLPVPKLPAPPLPAPQLAYLSSDSIPAAPNHANANYLPTYKAAADSLGFSIEELTKLLHSDHAFENMIPEISQPPSQYQNLYASPILSVNPANKPLRYPSPPGIPVGPAGYQPPQAAKPYFAPKPQLQPELPAPQPEPRPCVPKYSESASSEAGLDEYLRNIMYAQPPKERGHGYSLSF